MRRYETGLATSALAGANVALIGLFSGKDKGFGTRLDQLASLVAARGGRVVGRHVQRRGVLHGGVAKMTGKAREVAQACRAAGVDVAVFVNPLTAHQRTALADVFHCLVMSGEDLVARDR